MGLLNHHFSKELQNVVMQTFDDHFIEDPSLKTSYSNYQKSRMLEDIEYNLSFLMISKTLEDTHLFNAYMDWLMGLMLNLMPDVSIARMKEKMVTHLNMLKNAILKHLDEKDVTIYHEILNEGIQVINNYNVHKISEQNKKNDTYEIYKKTFLNYLLNYDTKRATAYLLEVYQKGIGMRLEDLYVDVIQEVMKEIGELWHQKRITVAQEHYMTAVTQSALSQFYPFVFSTDKIGKKVLSCSVGNELHEMGVRMISDLFEYKGWDSIYLGAAMPSNSILESIKQHQPDLIILSVTMPQHLVLCQEIVYDIKKIYPEIKVAVGGRAFSMTDQVWKKWPIDIYAKDAKELLDIVK